MSKETPNAIGYRKPPRATQWTKGQLANPKGRPRKSLNVSDLFTEMLRQKVVIKREKTTRRITRLQQVLETMIENAAEGQTPKVKVVLEHTRQNDALAAKQAKSDVLAPPDRKVLDVLYARLTEDALARAAQANEANGPSTRAKNEKTA